MGRKYWMCKFADVCTEEGCPVKGVHVGQAGSECYLARSAHQEKRPMREATIEEVAAAMLTGQLERTIENEMFDNGDGKGKCIRPWEGYGE